MVRRTCRDDQTLSHLLSLTIGLSYALADTTKSVHVVQKLLILLPPLRSVHQKTPVLSFDLSLVVLQLHGLDAKHVLRLVFRERVWMR